VQIPAICICPAGTENSSSIHRLASQLIYKDAAKVIIMSGAGVTLQKLIKKGTEPQLAKTLVQPVALNIRIQPNHTWASGAYEAPLNPTITSNDFG
jgi:GTPase Era involved in 16S rRNA processing